MHALAPRVWGRGPGTGVADALTAHGLGTLGPSERHATVAPENAASPVPLHRLGSAHVRDSVEEHAR